jgi:hypothetical protein
MLLVSNTRVVFKERKGCWHGWDYESTEFILFEERQKEARIFKPWLPLKF